MLSLEAHQPKYYHLGFGSKISRRNLGTANERRNCKIFEEFAYFLIEEARRSCYRNNFEIEVDGNVYALDSTTIDLCLSVFWWAEFRKHKGGIKLHTLYDIKTSIPSFLHISNALVHDVNIMDIIPYETGSFYVADKGYTDFMRLFKIHTNGSYFVISAKGNLQFKRMYSRKVDKSTGVQNDQIGKLVVYKSKKEYPEKLRRIKFYDCEHDKDLVFLTNNMNLKASEIAFLYKKLWEVELFFKALKASGFNIEDTHLTDIERLIKLLSLVLIAFAWVYKAGIYLDKLKPIKIKKHGRQAKSLFKYGLYYIAKLLFSNDIDKFNQCCEFLSCT